MKNNKKNMVNNLIPKFEEIREIKTEIPTYEEFLKTYKSDDRVNASYNDEINSLKKGYGPCYKDCGWANPNCECYILEKCVPLHLVCPAPKNSWPYCKDKNSGPFFHSSCGGGRSYIDTDLYIRCMKPGCGAIVHIRNASFLCSSHESDYSSKASKEALGNALTVLNSAWRDKNYTMKIYIEKMIDKLMNENGLLD